MHKYAQAGGSYEREEHSCNAVISSSNSRKAQDAVRRPGSWALLLQRGDLSCVQEATCAQAEAGPAAYNLQLQLLWQQQRHGTAQKLALVAMALHPWPDSLQSLQGGYNVPRQKEALHPKDGSAAPAAAAAAAAEAPKERPAPARAPSGKSLTALLQSRSEAMVALSERELARAPSGVPDIDAKDHADPLKASIYVRDIFSFYKRIEGNFRPSPEYMSRQVSPALPSHSPYGLPLMWHAFAPTACCCPHLASQAADTKRMSMTGACR